MFLIVFGVTQTSFYSCKFCVREGFFKGVTEILPSISPTASLSFKVGGVGEGLKEPNENLTVLSYVFNNASSNSHASQKIRVSLKKVIITRNTFKNRSLYMY